MLYHSPMASNPALGDPSSVREIYSVSRLNREAHGCLKDRFAHLWVEGEVSNLVRPASGHWYFSLKDSKAQIRCAMFRGRNQQLAFNPENGLQVLVQAQVALYEPRGDFQLVVERMEPAGDGALRLAYEQLKKKLSEQGLFDEQIKKSLPAFPIGIGIITSATGAAVRDILRTLHRRCPAIPVFLYPTAVQGEGAANEIARAIQIANQRQECDVLIVGRGGGSLEDLWAFNEEVVAYAAHQSMLPIVSAVGHEIDFTILDFVADLRASTPSAAAQLVCPDAQEWLHKVAQLQARSSVQIQHLLQTQAQSLDAAAKRLSNQHPAQQLQQRFANLRDLRRRLRFTLQMQIQHQHNRLAQGHAKLLRYHPSTPIEHLRDRVAKLRQRLELATKMQVERAHQRLLRSTRALHAVSPLATLHRGFAIVRLKTDGTLIRRAQQLKVGDAINAQLSKGTLTCRVEDIDHD